MRQVPTVSGKPESAMRSAPFVRGFKEARAGKPLNYEAFPYTGDQWQYERGRHFALIFNGALKDGARLTYDARRAMRDALGERALKREGNNTIDRWPDRPLARSTAGPIDRWPDRPLARSTAGPIDRWPDRPLAIFLNWIKPDQTGSERE